MTGVVKSLTELEKTEENLPFIPVKSLFLLFLLNYYKQKEFIQNIRRDMSFWEEILYKVFSKKTKLYREEKLYKRFENLFKSATCLFSKNESQEFQITRVEKNCIIEFLNRTENFPEFDYYKDLEILALCLSTIFLFKEEERIKIKEEKLFTKLSLQISNIDRIGVDIGKVELDLEHKIEEFIIYNKRKDKNYKNKKKLKFTRKDILEYEKIIRNLYLEENYKIFFLRKGLEKRVE